MLVVSPLLSLAITSVPVRLPRCVGAKMMLIVQLLPAASETRAQVSVSVKSPLIVTDPT